MSTAGRWVQQEMPSTTHLTKVTILKGVVGACNIAVSRKGPILAMDLSMSMPTGGLVSRETDRVLWRTYYVPRRL